MERFIAMYQRLYDIPDIKDPKDLANMMLENFHNQKALADMLKDVRENQEMQGKDIESIMIHLGINGDEDEPYERDD